MVKNCLGIVVCFICCMQGESMSGDAVLLRSRVSLIGNTFSKNMSLLSDEDRERIEREALQEVSAHCSPKAVSFVRYFLTSGTEADFSDVLDFCTDQKNEEIVNFHLAFDPNVKSGSGFRTPVQKKIKRRIPTPKSLTGSDDEEI